MGDRIKVVYRGNLRCEAIHQPTGARLTTEEAVAQGGWGEGFSPTDLVVAGLGSCILTTLGHLAQKHSWNLDGTTVDLDKDLWSEPKPHIGRVTGVVTLPAASDLTEDDRLRIEWGLAHGAVRQSLSPDIVIEITVRFAEPEPGG